MRIEGDHRRLQAGLLGARGDQVEHAALAAMDAVVVADGGDQAARQVGGVERVVDHLHGALAPVAGSCHACAARSARASRVGALASLFLPAPGHDVAHQVVGEGVDDLDLDQAAGRSHTVGDQQPAVDVGSHAPVAPREQMLALVADTFDQDLEPLADQGAAARQGDRPLALEQARLALARDRGRGAIRHLGRRRAAPRRCR